MHNVIVEMRGVTKRFGTVVANDRVDFELREREIHCLLGENGAGKSTLMSMLYGMWDMDEGEIIIRGQKVRFRNPGDAMAHKIGMVSQHFNLVPTVTVAENVVLAEIPSKKWVLIDRSAANTKVKDLVTGFGFKIGLEEKVGSLSAGEQQKVEILKAIYHEAEIVILDEPTAVLTPQETEELFGILRSMTETGKSVIIITHKLHEAMKSDRITVMRDGRRILTAKTNDLQLDDVTEAMFGNRLVKRNLARETKCLTEEVLLELEGVCTAGTGATSLKDISFRLRKGEIFGIAGVAGNGQKELVDAIMGICEVTHGKVLVTGKEITNNGPSLSRRMKICCIPEERNKAGLLQSMSIAENLILGRQARPPFSRAGFMNYQNVRQFAKEMIYSFGIKTAGIDIPVGHLSGGNAQKTILAREFASGPELIVASQPTRGLDAKTVTFVYEKLKEEQNRGKGILLISYDLDEILELADRITVLYNGKLEEVEDRDAYLIGRKMVGL